MLSTTISGLANLALNIIFIPKYGYIAAAANTPICYALVLSMVVVLSRHFFIWDFPFKSLIRVLCASIIMGPAVYYIANNSIFNTIVNLIISVVTSILLYTMLLILFKEISWNDLRKLLRTVVNTERTL